MNLCYQKVTENDPDGSRTKIGNKNLLSSIIMAIY